MNSKTYEVNVDRIVVIPFLAEINPKDIMTAVRAIDAKKAKIKAIKKRLKISNGLACAIGVSADA